MKSIIKKQTLVLAILCMTVNFSTFANIDVYEFDNARQEAQYRALIDEFRCPKCQNQNLAGSDAPIAQDLKQKTYDMVREGRSDTEIRQYMLERYGDFISYKPPVRPSTWILWFFPPILLMVILFWWWISHRHKNLRKTEETANHEQVLQPLSNAEQEKLAKILQQSNHSDLSFTERQKDNECQR